MFGLNNNNRYYFCTRTVDMRNGINGLYKLVKNEMDLIPISGDIFIFLSRNKQNIKLLKWDGDGFLLYHKRLEKGTFEKPSFQTESSSCHLPWDTFVMIMSGVSLKSARYRKRLKMSI